METKEKRHSPLPYILFVMVIVAAVGIAYWGMHRDDEYLQQHKEKMERLNRGADPTVDLSR